MTELGAEPTAPGQVEALAARCRREARASYLGDGRILCRALGRYHLLVDADDVGLTPNVVCDGYWEPGVTLALERSLGPGMVAVDIGANVGYFSLLMAGVVGPAGRVISIEANPALAALLRETVRMNRLEERIEVHDCAAADVAGELELHVPPGRNLNSCVVLEAWRERIEPAQVTRVRAVPPDDLLAGLPRVDVIKIDVEGAEHLVWSGLERTIAANPSLVIVLEFNFARHPRAGALLDRIQTLGFPLRFIDGDGTLRPVLPERLRDPGNLADWMLYLQRPGPEGGAA